MKNTLLPPLFSLLLLFASTVLQAEEHINIGRQEAANIALKTYPGRVLSVKPLRQGKSSVYRVKTLSADGNVHIVTIDAVSGQVISGR